MIRLAVFDFDSTLMDGETIDFLADAVNKKDEVVAITKKAMEGELDFFGSLTRRVSFLQGLESRKAKSICENLPFMKGAGRTILALKQRDIKVVVFSGGFTLATSHAKKVLGYDAEFANELHEKDGILTGLVGGEMMFGHSKGRVLKHLQNILQITKEQTMVVGDGANDLSMFAYADTKVAFCAKEILEKEATIKIKKRDLEEILSYID